MEMTGKNPRQIWQIITVSGLIFLMSVVSLGIPYAFLLRQNAIRKEIKQQIKQGVEEHDLFTFDLTIIEHQKSFEWINDHEFRYEAMLFDVTKRDGNIIRCINDVQEEKLFASLDHLARKKMNSSDHVKKQYSISSFIIPAFVTDDIFIDEEISNTVVRVNFISSYSEVLDSPPDRI